MRKRSWVIMGLLAAVVLGGVGLTIARNGMEESAAEKVFEFQLGKTMEATANQTRLPLSGGNTNGLLDAGYMGFPDNVYGRYVEPGYELKLGPLFGIRFYSDTKRYLDKKTETVTLSFDLDHITTPQQAYDYVYDLIAQFQRGKWKRYIPEECPRLQGKSSILNPEEIRALSLPVAPELKNFIGLGCPIDAAYKPELDKWMPLAIAGELQYLWHDEHGKIAKLDIDLSEPNSDGTFVNQGVSSVRIDLEFELEEVMLATKKWHLEDDLKKPWGERVAKVEIEKRRIRDVLEEIAVKRGEQLAER
ncbi:MAG: hypothetical protein IV085_07960 [Thiobacillus sp.]|nr:hypothetical protein [Thiobacillus sp.]